ncbi:hypothetical protein V2G26_016739 [Clonostachys chloroleuca]
MPGANRPSRYSLEAGTLPWMAPYQLSHLLCIYQSTPVLLYLTYLLSFTSPSLLCSIQPSLKPALPPPPP